MNVQGKNIASVTLQTLVGKSPLQLSNAINMNYAELKSDGFIFPSNMI